MVTFLYVFSAFYMLLGLYCSLVKNDETGSYARMAYGICLGLVAYGLAHQ